MKTLDELDALYAEATGGPWHVEHTGERGADVYSGSYPWGPDCGVGVVHASGTNAHADAAFIVALVNAWPEVRERLRRAEARVGAAREHVAQWDALDGALGEGLYSFVRTAMGTSITTLRAALDDEAPR
jgi:hypothetical protein